MLDFLYHHTAYTPILIYIRMDRYPEYQSVLNLLTIYIYNDGDKNTRTIWGIICLLIIQYFKYYAVYIRCSILFEIIYFKIK